MIFAALILDGLIIVTIFASAVLWFLASRNRLRRISRHEVLDSADINRIVTTMNRTQILNSRAALATALSALFAAIRVARDLTTMIN